MIYRPLLLLATLFLVLPSVSRAAPTIDIMKIKQWFDKLDRIAVEVRQSILGVIPHYGFDTVPHPNLNKNQIEGCEQRIDTFKTWYTSLRIVPMVSAPSIQASDSISSEQYAALAYLQICAEWVLDCGRIDRTLGRLSVEDRMNAYLTALQSYNEAKRLVLRAFPQHRAALSSLPLHKEWEALATIQQERTAGLGVAYSPTSLAPLAAAVTLNHVSSREQVVSAGTVMLGINNDDWCLQGGWAVRKGVAPDWCASVRYFIDHVGVGLGYSPILGAGVSLSYRW